MLVVLENDLESSQFVFPCLFGLVVCLFVLWLWLWFGRFVVGVVFVLGWCYCLLLVVVVLVFLVVVGVGGDCSLWWCLLVLVGFVGWLLV